MIYIHEGVCPVCDGVTRMEVEAVDKKKLGVQDDCPTCHYFYGSEYGVTFEGFLYAMMSRSWRAEDRDDKTIKLMQDRQQMLEESRDLWRDPEFKKLWREGWELQLYTPEEVIAHHRAILKVLEGDEKSDRYQYNAAGLRKILRRHVRSR